MKCMKEAPSYDMISPRAFCVCHFAVMSRITAADVNIQNISVLKKVVKGLVSEYLFYIHTKFVKTSFRELRIVL